MKALFRTICIFISIYLYFLLCFIIKVKVYDLFSFQGIRVLLCAIDQFFIQHALEAANSFTQHVSNCIHTSIFKANF